MAKPKTDDSLQAALAALRTFAFLPLPPGCPDDAHPAYQIKASFIRDARKLFPDDFGADGEPLPDPAVEPEGAGTLDDGQQEGGEVDKGHPTGGLNPPPAEGTESADGPKPD